jgi:glycosyltransferase involved in cell wall biosynthesis
MAKPVKNQRIILINQDSGYLMVDLANYLSDQGVDVTLITGRINLRNHPLSGRIKVRKIIRYNRKSGLARIVTWITGFIQVWFMVLFVYNKHYLLLVTNPPISTFLPGLCNNRYSLLIFDLYPDVLVNMHKIVPESIISKTWMRLNKKTFSKADSVFTLGTLMKELAEKYSDKNNLAEIKLWSDNDYFKPIPKSENKFIKENGLEGKFIVLYSGNLGITHNPESFAEIASKVKSPDVLFLVISSGEGTGILQRETQSMKLKNIRFMPLLPADLLPFSFASASLGIISLSDQASNCSIPSKTFNYLSAGIPLLCLAGKDSELSRLVTKYENGTCFDHSCTSEIALFIDELSGNETQLMVYSKNSLVASGDFSSSNAQILAEKIIQSISI